MRERGGGYWVLVRKSEEKRPLGRPRPRWEDSFEMDVKKWDGGRTKDSSGSIQGQVVGSCECGDVPSGSIKCGGIS
jgi:hypothetical protein